MTHILLIYSCLHKSLQYALNQTYLNTIIGLFPIQLTHLIILTQYKALSSYILTTYPKFLNPIKIFLFPFSGKAYKVYEAVPSTNKESIGKGKPRKPLGLPFNHFCLHFITGSPRITLILRNRKYFVK